MTTAPRQPPPSPPLKPTAQHEPQRDSHAERKAERKAERDEVPPDDPHPDVTTTQEDQMERSAEIEQMGVEDWKNAHDERNQPDQQRERRATVAGVSPTQKDDRRA